MMMMAVAAVDAVRPVDDPTEGEGEAEDGDEEDPYDPPGYLGHVPPIQRPLVGPGINRLDQIAKQHDIDYSRAKNLQDKWKADTKMIQAIDRLPGKKTKTERVVKKIMQAKKRLKL